MNLLNRDRVLFAEETDIFSGLPLFQGLQQNPFFSEGEKRLQVVDKDNAVLSPGYAGDVFHPGQDVVRGNPVNALLCHDVVNRIRHQGNRQGARSGDDELISGADFPFRQPESLSHIQDRNNHPPDIQDAEHNSRRFGERGYCRRPDDSFH